MKAEFYLEPFFQYDLDSVYEIAWDSEADGGIDGDASTLSVSLEEDGGVYAYGISRYLPYGDYVLANSSHIAPSGWILPISIIKSMSRGNCRFRLFMTR